MYQEEKMGIAMCDLAHSTVEENYFAKNKNETPKGRRLITFKPCSCATCGFLNLGLVDSTNEEA